MAPVPPLDKWLPGRGQASMLPLVVWGTHPRWCYRPRRNRVLRSLSMLSETTVAPAGAGTVVS
jgi:hypothetical protein